MPMKCQHCEKPATFHITDLVDGKPNELHLCEECASERGVAPQPQVAYAFTGDVGYDVGVVFDTPGDAWPPIWVLREMHSAPFEIQGKTIDVDGVSLALPIKPVTEPAITGEQKQKFLRERGLFLADGTFDLFEVIIEPGSTYEMLWPSAPASAPPILRAAPQARAGDPYR